MKKLKNISVFDKVILLLIVILIFNIIFCKNNSVYSGNEKKICGRIKNLISDNDKVTMEIKSREKVIGNFYFKNSTVKNNFDDNYHLGDEICVNGTLERPNDNTVFNLFSYRKYLLSKRIYYSIDIDKVEKVSNNSNFVLMLKNKIIQRISNISRSQGYLFAFVLGDSRYIDNDIISAYRSVGVSHLFAVSGMHVSFLSGFILFFLNYFLKNPKIKLIITTVFILLFTSLFMMSPSIIRAVSLFLCLTLDKILRLKQKPIRYLIVICIINLIINRYAVYNVGFVFSYMISFSLLLYQERLKNIKGKLKLSLFISIISFLISIPILVYNFFEINLLTPLVNLFVIPYVSFLLFPGAFICLLFPGLDNIYSWLIKALELLISSLNCLDVFKISLAKPSFEIIIAYYILVFLVIHMLFKRKYSYFFVLIAVILFHHNIRLFDSTNKLYMLDVGQGDCLLLTTASNKSLLIDTGGNMYSKSSSLTITKLIPFFKSIGLNKLNYMILTHGDYDHMGEAINLVEKFKIENVVFNVGVFNDLELELVKILKRKKIPYYQNIESLNIGKDKFYFLNTKDYNNENENSSVIYTELNNKKILLMGDAGIKKERDVIDKYNLEQIDFLKIGHHGSNTSTSKVFIDKINPKNCLISVGKNNIYGHPKDSVLDILADCNVFRTDFNGSVEIKLKNDNYNVRTTNP